MASTDARPVARKNVAYRVYFPILDADGDLVTGATGLDSEVSLDGAAFADCTNEATEIGASGMYYLDLTSGEMNADAVVLIVKTTSSGAKTTPIVFYPEEAGDFRADVTHYGGTAGTFSGGRAEVNVSHWLGTAAQGASGRPQVDVELIEGADATDVLDALDNPILAILGTPAGASLAADILQVKGYVDDIGVAGAGLTALPWPAAWDAEVESEVTDALNAYDPPTRAEATSDKDAILAKLPAALVGGRMDSNVQAMANDVLTSAALAASAVTEIQAGLSTLDAAGVRTAVGLAAANLDTQLAALAAFIDTEVNSILAAVDTEIAAIKAKTDLIPGSPAAVGSAMTLTSGERDSVAAALLDLAAGIETGLTLRQGLRVFFAALAGKSNSHAAGTPKYRNRADSLNRIDAVTDADGNRSTVTLDLS